MASGRKKSTKRSAASSGRRPPDPAITILTDECLGRHDVPDALRRAGATVIAHHEKFPPGTADDVWLSALAEHPDWIVVTKDTQIRRRPLERQAYMNARARVFTLTSGNLTGLEQAAVLARALPKVRKLAKRRGPFIAKITASGVVEILKFK